MTYMEQMKQDIMDYIKAEGIEVTEGNRDEIAERLNDDLWIEDSVTGNASGSYYCNAYKAREQVLEYGEEYIRELIREFDLDAETIADHFMDWEYWDASIRCYLLGQAIEAALDEIVGDDDDDQ